MIKCEICEQEKKESEFYSTLEYEEHQVCSDCEKNIENPTGYCSIGCRLTGECDGSC